VITTEVRARDLGGCVKLTARDPGEHITVTTTPESVGDLRNLIPDFERSLRASNKAAKTVKIYGEAARGLVKFLVANGMPTEAAKVRREHIE